MDEYRSPADANRNSGDCHPDDEAQFWNWVESQAAADYLNKHSTTTK